MPLRIGNYGSWSGDRRDPKKRPGYGHHPPACTCWACREGKKKAEARDIADAADSAIRRSAWKPAPAPARAPVRQYRRKPQVGFLPILLSLAALGIMVAGITAFASQSSTDAPDATPTFPYPVEIELWVITYTNLDRELVGLPPLEYDERLSAAARAHSENMATQGKLAHRLDGTTPTSRGLAAGYQCSARLPNGYHMSGVAENILQFPVEHRKTRWPWSEEPNWNPFSYDVQPKEIARGMVSSWMASDGHRANIMDPDHRSIGVGVASVQSMDGSRSHEERFYATQNFSAC